MLHSLVQTIITYLHHHPHAAGIIVFFIACGEALAVIGTVIPGSVTMTAVGVLIGSRVIPAYSTLVWAMAGAVLGDFISYAVGLYYKNRIHKIWPFRKYPQWLEKGEKFFSKHGMKSIIIGRFFGPARSMVPLVAGTFNMRPGRFLLAAIPSASIWAVGYMIPGILVGAISLELPPGLAIEFIVAVLIIIAACVGLTWIIQYGSRHLAKKIDSFTKRIWKNLRQHKKSHWITSLLTDPRHPRNHRQLIVAIYMLITGSIFLIIALNVFTHGPLTDFNLSLSHFMRSVRTSFGDNIILPFTVLGTPSVILSMSGLMLLWFGYKRYWRVAIHWALIMVLIVGAVGFIKLFFFSPRPGFLLNTLSFSSFPSGHTSLSVCFFGSLAMLVAQELRFTARRIPYIIAIIMVGLIGFSRIYLGAHWLTDIVGSIFLGLTVVALVVISYRRGNIQRINLKQFLIAIFTVVLGTWIIAMFMLFPKYKHNYTIAWPKATISKQDWLSTKALQNGEIPWYRPSRFGHPKEVFNVEWLDNLENIKTTLQQQGWKIYPPNFTLKGLLGRLSTTASKSPLPLIPQIYHNKYPVLLMTKSLNGDPKTGQTIILRLWHSSVSINGTDTQFWLGVVSYRHPYHQWFTIRKLYGIHVFLGATNDLLPYIKNYHKKLISYPVKHQPKVLRHLHWDGKLLLIY